MVRGPRAAGSLRPGRFRGGGGTRAEHRADRSDRTRRLGFQYGAQVSQTPNKSKPGCFQAEGDGDSSRRTVFVVCFTEGSPVNGRFDGKQRKNIANFGV